jgi:hypothetical protein
LLIYVGVEKSIIYSKYFLIIFVALQPLHSYTTIGLSVTLMTNGFEHLHAELCGTKYSGSISHTKKISDLLDKINTAIITDMAVDCVCCEAIDIAQTDFIDLPSNNLLISRELLMIKKIFTLLT